MKNGMLKYVCHKTVHAAEILAIIGNRLEIKSADGIDTYVDVSSEFMAKHNPQLCGYLVEYEDGYMSFSPAKAFENGYDLVPDQAQVIG